MDKISTDILKRIKVLYVEDEDEAREELYELLKRRVGKIFVASNGETGLELFNENLPDIVIADLFMPKMGGIEMVKSIRKTGKDPGVIITSAIGDVDVILKAVDAGISKYIIKPINVKMLLEELIPLAERIISKREEVLPVSEDKKKLLEGEIKKNFAAFLKNATGKGPKEVSVFLMENHIEITAFDTMTLYEKSLLDNFQNCAIIKQNRDLFYDVKAEEISKMIYEIVGRNVEIAKTGINVEKDTNKLILSYI